MAEKVCCLLKGEKTQKLLSSVDNFIFDCDGVLYHGTDAIPGAREVLEGLRKLGKRVFFVTNNSTRSRTECIQMFERMGFHALKDEIYTPAFVAAYYLKNILNFDIAKKVYVLGMQSMADELDEMGIKNLGVGPDIQEQGINPQTQTHLKLDPDVGAVLCGFDGNFSLPKMIKATSYLERNGCIFLATNYDDRMPLGPNMDIIIPGTGCQIVAIEVAARRKPILIGKPSNVMVDCLCKSHKDVQLSRTCMVGDSLHTDILFGSNNGMKTLFVETGNSSLHQVKELEKSSDQEKRKQIPDFYLSSIAGLVPVIRQQLDKSPLPFC